MSTAACGYCHTHRLSYLLPQITAIMLSIVLSLEYLFTTYLGSSIKEVSDNDSPDNQNPIATAPYFFLSSRQTIAVSYMGL